MPEIVRRLEPAVLVLNNLFRDQLDRYGELDTIATRWRAALLSLPESATMVVNVDDPTLASISEDVAARRIAFGLDDPNPLYHLSEVPHAADAKSCRQCGRDLAYDRLYSAHLGAWQCPGCGAKRPDLDFAGENISLKGVDSLSLQIVNAACADEPLTINLAVPGLYNAYNALAATSAARTLGVPGPTIASALAA